MQGIKLALLAALVTTLALSQAPKKATNIEYLSMGYNIYLGNPLANSLDPGFQIDPIFNFTYNEQSASADGTYLQPDSITIASDLSCVLNSAASAISGANSYLKSLDTFVSVDAGCPSGGFSASVGYKTASQSSSNGSTYYTLATGQCSVYVAQMSLLDVPQLTDQFIQDVITYLSSNNTDMHYQFLDGYGTHFVRQITMGSRLSVMNSVSESAWENMESQGISVTAAAQASFMGFYAGFSASVTTDSSQVTSYESSSSTFDVTTIGSVPPTGGNSIEWAQQAVTDPMPITYSLTPLNELFNSTRFMTAVQGASSPQTLELIQANLNAAFAGGYCNYLSGQNIVATCFAIGPDQAIPGSTVSCVMCASGCGGAYSISQGIFDYTMDQPTWMMDYPSSCSSTSLLDENSFTGGVDLCCVPETSGSSQGSCKMCTSCGGQFWFYAGSVWDNFSYGDFTDADGWFQAYGDSCEGDLSPQGAIVNPVGYGLCCDRSDACAMCSTCGGAYPYETGELGVDDTTQAAFSFYENDCSGTLGFQKIPGPGGIKLCCSHL